MFTVSGGQRRISVAECDCDWREASKARPRWR